MKRIGNLFEKICSIDNLILAENKARKGKSKQHGVRLFDENKEDLIINLHHVLLNGDFRTSKYEIFRIFDGKERIIFKLPYYMDRIVHHGILNILEPIFVSNFTADTYSCIKGRGIHLCLDNLKKALKNNDKYCLKLDIKKFYPSINGNILKQLLRTKFKDSKLLILLDNIIDSNSGMPIGNYCSQVFANFYLTKFDHWIKQELKIKHYFRYCDDIVILGNNKDDLRIILKKIVVYLQTNLKLILSNYQIFPISVRGIDFLGYKTFHDYCWIRKSIKKRFIKMIKYNNNSKSRASYYGWLCHANTINLQNKYLK